MIRAQVTSILIAVIASFCIKCHAQEIQFSQYRSFPLYVNPATTGNIEQQRIALVSRNQWMGIKGAFNTVGFAYVFNGKKIKIGLGLIVAQDETSNGGFSTFTAGGLYSYHIRLTRLLHLNSGLRVSFVQQKLNPDKLTFGDQLIRNDGSATYETFGTLSHNFVDFSWGNILFFSDSSSQAKSYWLGFALDHLSKPRISFVDYEGKMPIKFTIHAGAQYRLNQNEIGFPENVISFSLLYKSQLKWDQAELGVSWIRRLPHKKRTLVEWKKVQAKFEPSYLQNFGKVSRSKMPMPLVYLEMGLTYRGLPFVKKYGPGHPNNEAVIILIGFSYYKFMLAYTFDITISKLKISNTGGAHELSLVYNFAIPVSEKRVGKRISKKRRALFD